MRTFIIVLAGFLLLAVFLLVARLISGSSNGSLATAAKVFILLWLIAAGINMWIGVSQAGYSIAEEFPIFLLIFAVPAAAAGFIWRRFSRGAGAERGSPQ